MRDQLYSIKKSSQALSPSFSPHTITVLLSPLSIPLFSCPSSFLVFIYAYLYMFTCPPPPRPAYVPKRQLLFRVSWVLHGSKKEHMQQLPWPAPVTGPRSLQLKTLQGCLCTKQELYLRLLSKEQKGKYHFLIACTEQLLEHAVLWACLKQQKSCLSMCLPALSTVR